MPPSGAFFGHPKSELSVCPAWAVGNSGGAATGANPKGHVVLEVPPFLPDYRGRVTCLNVVGNDATVGIDGPDEQRSIPR
jgi:hypothetical protein